MRGLGGLFHTDAPLDEGEGNEEGLGGVDCSFEALGSVKECVDMEGVTYQLAATGPIL